MDMCGVPVLSKRYEGRSNRRCKKAPQRRLQSPRSLKVCRRRASKRRGSVGLIAGRGGRRIMDVETCAKQIGRPGNPRRTLATTVVAVEQNFTKATVAMLESEQIRWNDAALSCGGEAGSTHGDGWLSSGRIVISLAPSQLSTSDAGFRMNTPEMEFSASNPAALQRLRERKMRTVQQGEGSKPNFVRNCQRGNQEKWEKRWGGRKGGEWEEQREGPREDREGRRATGDSRGWAEIRDEAEPRGGWCDSSPAAPLLAATAGKLRPPPRSLKRTQSYGHRQFIKRLTPLSQSHRRRDAAKMPLGLFVFSVRWWCGDSGLSPRLGCREVRLGRVS